MAAMVSQMTSAPVWLGDYTPNADERLVMRGLDWAGYQTLLALRGDRRSPRMAYLDGAVELIGTSRGHENIKSRIGSLVETYCVDRTIPINTYGNWHLDDQAVEAGVEPDDCFIFGRDFEARQRPDLAIEVVWTSGGIKKLEVYRRLRVGEVWFWKQDAICVHVLAGDTYEERERSACLPDLDLALICRLALLPTLNEAVDQLRAALR